MKITVEIDCTPAEARQFFGLPDLQPMQDRLMGDFEKRLRVAMHRMSPDVITKQWFSLWDMNSMKTVWEKMLSSKIDAS